MNQETRSRTVAVFLADGFEEIEAITIIDLLRRADIKVITLSLNESLTVIGSHMIEVKADQLIDSFDPKDVDMFILPGGLGGAQALSADDRVKEILNWGFEAKKLMGAICAAPFVLGELGLLKGVKATCYPGFEPQLEGAFVKNKAVVEDQQFITSQGPATAFEFALTLIERLRGEEVRKRLERDTLY